LRGYDVVLWRRAYGLFLLAGSAGALAVVPAYARLLRRGMAPVRTVLLLGGPWEGRMLLPPAGPVPEEVWRAAAGASACCYRHPADERDRPQMRVLRYEPADEPRPTASF
jgi:hypothetical protein